MSVPALAQMGTLTGERRYFDDGVKQVLQFAQRMFDEEKGPLHPRLGPGHGGAPGVPLGPRERLGAADAGGAARRPARGPPGSRRRCSTCCAPTCAASPRASPAAASGTSCSTARTPTWRPRPRRSTPTPWPGPSTGAGSTRWPTVRRSLLAWNAVTTKVNAQGQVEGTCVGTGMGFDPAFYYHRPTSAFAAHGYGPVLLAGAEMVRLLKAIGSRSTTAACSSIGSGAVPKRRSRTVDGGNVVLALRGPHRRPPGATRQTTGAAMDNKSLTHRRLHPSRARRATRT